MSHVSGPLPCLLVLAALAAPLSPAIAAPQKQNPPTKKTEAASAASHERKATPPAPAKHAEATKARSAHHVVEKGRKAPADDKRAEKDPSRFTGDLAIVSDALALARKGKTADAIEAEKTITDPAGQKLVEWFLLRHPDSQASFERYAAFIADHHDWPGITLLRRRAEARLWNDKIDASIVHAFTADQPVTAKGRLALGRVLLGEGDREGAQRVVRAVFRSEEFSERTESDLLDAFRDLLDRDDYQARMDKRLGAKDWSAAMRAARRVGDDAVSIVKACSAVKGDDKASDRLDSVATDAREDLGYVLCRAQWQIRKDKISEAARTILSAPKQTMTSQDTDEWWRVRRSLARKLLDQGEYRTAYEVVRNAALPAAENYRSDAHFMPGWIALRYLDDANLALVHFARIDEGCVNPITLARAAYWRGRAAEALGDKEAVRAHYEMAARHTTAYYGQLARARLGLDSIELRTPQQGNAEGGAANDEIVRAAEMLYALGDRDAAILFAADLGEDSTDLATLAAVAEVTGRNNDARAMLELGRTALARGLPLDAYAFPTIGIPPHAPIGPDIGRSMIYSVARTESAFNQKDRSSAMAVGLMQVTPEAARDTAKRFRVEYDWDRLVSDPVYNTQMGAAEISALLQEYRGSLLMTFAGYNAGRGRVRDWIKAYGDPRDPHVDAVDWAERIPFAETRNYVQRVIENFLVYQQRFEGQTPAMATIDHGPPAAQTSLASAP
jgi:soluble lytic murein transglycosylase